MNVKIYLDTGVGGLRIDLEVAHPSLGEHYGGVGVDLDGLSEQSDGFLPLTLIEKKLIIMKNNTRPTSE